jgi:hypothetical protein
MGGQDQRPDDGKNRTQGREDDAARPLAEGGEKTNPERFPPVKKDDSVQPSGEQRSFDGDTGYTEPGRRSGGEGPDPSVSHGQTDDAGPDDPR